MNPSTLIFLSKNSPTAVVLQQLKSKNAALPIDDTGIDEMWTVRASIDSSDGYYLVLKMPYPASSHSGLTATIMVPHRDVLLVVQADGKDSVGFHVGK